MFGFLKKINIGVAKLISVVYFMQGFVGISGIALPLFLRSIGFSVKEIAWYMSIVIVPWFFKIIYGAISDIFPIFQYRRKPYLMIYYVLASAGWVLMSVLPARMAPLVIAMMVCNLGFSAIDVVTDSIVVEHSNEQTSQIYQSIAWGFRSFGALISGVLGGYFAAEFNYRLIFLWTAALPLVSFAALRFYKESKTTVKPDPNFLLPLIKCVKFLFTGDLFWFSLFIVIASCSSSLTTPLFFYMKEKLGFDEQFLGILSSTTWGGAIVGSFIYLKFLKQIRLKYALGMALVVGFFAIMSCVLIQNKTSAIVIFIIAGMLGCISILPLVSSAAKLANATGVEGSLFAVLMSIQNFGNAGSTFLGGWLFERIGLHMLIISVACLTLLGLLVVRKLETI